MRLVLATRNVHKVREISRLLERVDVEVLSFRDFDELPTVVEDGETLEENAIKKAETIAAATGLPTLADDTGLEVAGLGGVPGVESARYAGPGATYDDNNKKLLAALEGASKSDRRAAFRCVVAFAEPGERTQTVEGRTEGVILSERRGEGGFGYDPLFLPDGQRLTYAEMDEDTKNAVSHRGRAVRKAAKLVASRLAAGRAGGPSRSRSGRP